MYLRLQKIAKQNPKYYSKLSSGPFAWKSINESWGQKVKPCSKFFPNPDDELAKKELRNQESYQKGFLCFQQLNSNCWKFLKYADELNRDICDLEAEMETAEMVADMAGGDGAEAGEIAEMEAADQAEASMENI